MLYESGNKMGSEQEKRNNCLLREFYKPDKVRILFVGESPPRGGTFFYKENSLLYRYTKEAFEQAKKPFSLEYFRHTGCWLFDVCENPVDGLSARFRRQEICDNKSRLISAIQSVTPEFIVVVKKGDMKKIVFEAIINTGDYTTGATAFNLPFPACGHQNQYRNELVKIISAIM